MSKFLKFKVRLLALTFSVALLIVFCPDGWTDPGDEDLVPWPFEFQCPIIWEHLQGTWTIRESSHQQAPQDYFKIAIFQLSSAGDDPLTYRFVITRYSDAHHYLSEWSGEAVAGSREWKAFLSDDYGPRSPAQEPIEGGFFASYFRVVIRVFEQSLSRAQTCLEKDLVTVITLKSVAQGDDGDVVHHYLLEKQ